MTSKVKNDRNPKLALAAVAAVVTVLANILWAIFSGSTRDVLTIVGVLAFSMASGLHAYIALGSARLVKFVSLALATTFIIEIIGVKTGIPFGTYEYDPARLGPTLLQVPLLIPFAWFMMLYPSWLVVNDLAHFRFWLTNKPGNQSKNNGCRNKPTKKIRNRDFLAGRSRDKPSPISFIDHLWIKI